MRNDTTLSADNIKKRAFKIFPELLGVLASGCIRTANAGSYEDFLGELYMDLGASNERNGQYFTPMAVSSDGKTDGNRCGGETGETKICFLT